MNKKKLLGISFALATTLVAGQMAYAATSNSNPTSDNSTGTSATMSSNDMSGMMNNGNSNGMMGNANMSKMMNAMNSPEGQNMINSCSKFMNSYGKSTK
ncbi:hypothetical protein LSG31_09285 [Fodinisporobacter ferrooxydans]|uniref:Pentapeptide MXKDX repeat protein n=1 Tax=Fodinisporobacter ferrooxydans TaxID=2901836 RepID=A0ABY4CSC4_9BACL|nr:hypothetical protein LSG31_09285 [Alicyclobacillaceae bacterium MYW30-H2]